MHVGDDHWLVVDEQGLPEVRRLPSIRTTPFELPMPLGIVWHWTGGVCRGQGAMNYLAEEIRNFDKSKDRASSFHAIIAKDGRIIQTIPFNTGSWHVGKPGRIGGAKPAQTDGRWDAVMFTGGKLFGNINRCTLGIELLNAGRLEKVGEKFYTSPYWLNPDKPESGPDPKLEIEPERAVNIGAQWFDTYPDEQVFAAQRLTLALVQKYKLPREVCQYGHLHFDSPRKEDPGPLWLDQKLPPLLNAVFGPEAP